MEILRKIKDRLHGKTSKEHKRSSDWPKIRKEWIKFHPECALCGSKKKLEVHHKVPFHIASQLELDPNNLITLCESKTWGKLNCHLLFGHLGNYKSFNAEVQSDCERWHKKFNMSKNWNNLKVWGKSEQQKEMEKDL